MSAHVVLTFPHALGVPGGGSVHCRRLALDLRRAGAEVTLLPVESRTMSMWPRPAPSPELASRTVAGSLEAAGIAVRPCSQHPAGWWFDARRVRGQLTSILENQEVNAVLFWWAELSESLELLAEKRIFVGLLAAAPYALWWGRSHGRPRWLHRRMDERLVAGTARRASRVFANSSHTAGELTSLLGVEASRVQVVHPPVSARFLRPDRVLSGTIERLIYFGRLRPEKGIFDLLEALSRLGSVSWQLRVAGSGDEAAVRRAIARLGIENQVTILGEIGADQLEVELDRAQVAVLPSYAESFGLSAAEALLAGLPVIAYDIPAMRDLLGDGESGWLVRRGQLDRLAEALREALTDPRETRRRGLAARGVGLRLAQASPGATILESIRTWRAE